MFHKILKVGRYYEGNAFSIFSSNFHLNRPTKNNLIQKKSHISSEMICLYFKCLYYFRWDKEKHFLYSTNYHFSSLHPLCMIPYYLITHVCTLCLLSIICTSYTLLVFSLINNKDLYKLSYYLNSSSSFLIFKIFYALGVYLINESTNQISMCSYTISLDV